MGVLILTVYNDSDFAGTVNDSLFDKVESNLLLTIRSPANESIVSVDDVGLTTRNVAVIVGKFKPLGFFMPMV